MYRCSRIKYISLPTKLFENPGLYVFMKKIGLYVLCALLLVQPFHFFVTKYLFYYREIFAVVFSILIVQYLLNNSIVLSMRIEVFFILLFLFALILFALFDPGNNLYEEIDYYGEVSETISDGYLALYVLRNALLYIPMICYLALRGLSEKEVKKIAVIVTFVAPISIVAFLYNVGFFPSFNIIEIVSLGGNPLQWNSYVPYLTFPFIASLYLVIDLRTKLLKLLFIFIGLFLFLYIFVSASRQSFAFCILMALLYAIFVPTHNRIHALLIVLSVILILYFMVNYTLSHYIIHENLIDRYITGAAFIETTRLEIMKDGLLLLNLPEFLLGAGLSSVIISGPHNDFIRWTQRVGIPGMVLSFLPFFLSLIYFFRFIRQRKMIPILLFIFSALLFPIYHSFFGYPREDAYQALYAFLGIGLWLGISKN